MTAEVRAEPIVHERSIDASPETVFAFFTDAEKLTRWLAVEATLEPRDGGTWLTLVHRDLPQSERADRDAGWDEMISRLATAVAVP